MGSLRFAGVRFVIYVDDHPPPHVHAQYAEIAVVIDLLAGGGVAVSRRPYAIMPPNAKQNDLNRVMRIARVHEAAFGSYGGAYTRRPEMTDEELEAPLDAETEAMMAEALERVKHEPAPITATKVHFNQEYRLLIVTFSSGQRLAIPQEDLQYLAEATVEDAAEVTVEMLGMGLHWEKLDLDFSVHGLLEGRRGSVAWMNALHERRYGHNTLLQSAVIHGGISSSQQISSEGLL